jgi:hypothetical protein
VKSDPINRDRVRSAGYASTPPTDIADAQRAVIDQWLAPGAQAWRTALAPLTAAERTNFVKILHAYERALSEY